MKKITILTLLLFFSTIIYAQQTVTNRYGMKLSDNGDGSYGLVDAHKYNRILDTVGVDALLEPYVYVPDRIKKSDYYPLETREYVFKSYPDYELKLAIDFAVSDKATPFMIYIHGGGWARGDFNANKLLSQYLAKQSGITGVRISYTLAPQSGANINVTIEDVKDALAYIKEHAQELNIDPNNYGFAGGSAGGHLAAVGAMTTGAKVFVGFAGIYDLNLAAITKRATAPERVAYFLDLDPELLRSVSPVSLIPTQEIPASMLVCGTGDVVVEYAQSEIFAAAIKAKGGEAVLDIYDYYSHNLNSKGSSIMEQVILKAAAFIAQRLNRP